jgi:hypothetical protein
MKTYERCRDCGRFISADAEEPLCSPCQDAHDLTARVSDAEERERLFARDVAHGCDPEKTGRDLGINPSTGRSRVNPWE